MKPYTILPLIQSVPVYSSLTISWRVVLLKIPDENHAPARVYGNQRLIRRRTREGERATFSGSDSLVLPRRRCWREIENRRRALLESRWNGRRFHAGRFAANRRSLPSDVKNGGSGYNLERRRLPRWNCCLVVLHRRSKPNQVFELPPYFNLSAQVHLCCCCVRHE